MTITKQKLKKLIAREVKKLRKEKPGEAFYEINLPQEYLKMMNDGDEITLANPRGVVSFTAEYNGIEYMICQFSADQTLAENVHRRAGDLHKAKSRGILSEDSGKRIYRISPFEK